MVGWVVGLSVWWVVQPSQVMVLLVHRGLLAAGVGFWAVVVVVGLVVVAVVVVAVVLGVVLVLVVVVVVVVVVVGTLVAVVVVLGLVVVVVLCARPQDPLGIRWGVRVGQHWQPLWLHGLVDSEACQRPRSTGLTSPGRSGRLCWQFVGGGSSGA